MRSSDLKALVALNQERDLKKASSLLSVSPAVLLRQINRLEKEIDAKMILINNGEIAFTDYSSVLLPFAHQICNTEDACLKDILNEESQKYHLRVGYTHSLDSLQTKDFLFSFQRKNTFVETFLFASDSDTLEKQVISGECDIALVLRSANQNNPLLHHIPVSKNQLYAVIPISHELSRYGTLKFEQLKDQPLLLPPKDTAVNNLCHAECQKAGFEPNAIFTSSNPSDLIELSSMGYGIGIVSQKSLILQSVQDVALVHLTSSEPLTTELIYRKDSISPSIYYFLTSIDIAH